MMKLLHMSLSASIVIALVLAIRAIGKRSMRPQAFLVLWGIVLLRLLLPFSVPVSLFPSFGQATLMESQGMNYTNGYHAPEYTFSPSPTPQDVVGSVLEVARINVHPVILVWLAGVSICAAYILVSHLRHRHIYQQAIPMQDCYLDQWITRHPLLRGYSIKVSDRILSPLTAGVGRPTILLPKDLALGDKPSLAYVLTHEYTHIKQFHVVWKAVALAACCLHWFNPLVWVMLSLLNRDMENICDEAVVHQWGPACRRDYALLLLRIQAADRNLLSVTLPLDKTAIEERISMIMKKQHKRFALLSLLLVLLCAVTAFATSPVAEQDQTSSDETSQQAENGYDPTLFLRKAWEEDGFFDILRPFGVEPDAAGVYPFWNGEVLHGLYDPQVGSWQYTAEEDANGDSDTDMYNLVVPEDGLFAAKVYDDAGVLIGLEQMTYSEYIAKHPLRRDWTEGFYSQLTQFGVEPDEQWKPMYEGKQVVGILDEVTRHEHNGLRWDSEKGEEIPPTDEDIYLLVLYANGSTTPTGVEVLTEEELPDTYFTYAKRLEQEKEQAERYKQYEPFGFVEGIYEEGNYVLGFWDGEQEGVGYTVVTGPNGKMEETVEGGVWDGYVYLIAERDDAGELTGLKVVSMDEFKEISGYRDRPTLAQ